MRITIYLVMFLYFFWCFLRAEPKTENNIYDFQKTKMHGLHFSSIKKDIVSHLISEILHHSVEIYFSQKTMSHLKKIKTLEAKKRALEKIVEDKIKLRIEKASQGFLRDVQKLLINNKKQKKFIEELQNGIKIYEEGRQILLRDIKTQDDYIKQLLSLIGAEEGTTKIIKLNQARKRYCNG